MPVDVDISEGLVGGRMKQRSLLCQLEEDVGLFGLLRLLLRLGYGFGNFVLLDSLLVEVSVRWFGGRRHDAPSSNAVVITSCTATAPSSPTKPSFSASSHVPSMAC